ncbi:Hsp70 family protein [Desulfobacterales bacterium HSG2]|nr:Hsp70 family protein [Desulfobacterales bacterium HSG2]
MRICEKCDTEYEKGRFCTQCGSDLKEKKSGEGIFNCTPDELETIDRSLEPRLVRAQTKAAEAEQMALDAARLLSCTEDRLDDYAGQGFFKRCWHKLCGKQGEMQRANQKDLIEMQKYAWRYIDLLQDRDLLLAHSVITVKNNLMTLAVEQEETKNEIARMAEKVYKRFVALENRAGVLEAATNIHSWLLTIETYDYDEKFPPHFRLLRVVRDFLSLKEDDWNITEIKYLQKAVKDAGLPWKKKIRLADFVCELTDEIEDSSFSQYQELLLLDFGEPGSPIPASFILENVSVPSFTSLYQIADSYTGSSAVIDVLSEELNISRKEAVRKVLTAFIRKQGIDLEIAIPLRDLAVELLNCMKLTKKLFESFNNEQNFQQPHEKEESDFTSASADSDIPEEEKTFKWYLKAAEQGDAEAQSILAESVSSNFMRKDIVLAVPVYFDRFMRRNICYLLSKWGIQVHLIVESPVLAGLAYGHKYNKYGVTFVCELDNDNIDIALIDMEAGVYEVISVSNIDISEILNAEDEIKKLFLDTLESCGILTSDIDDILFYAQGNLSDLILNIIKDNLNGELKIWDDDKEGSPSAIGASIQYGVHRGDIKNVLLLDITTLDILIKVGDNSPQKIIERYTTKPTKKSLILYPIIWGSQAITEVILLEGNHSDMKKNKIIGKLFFESIPLMDKGLEVIVDIYVRGSIVFTAISLADSIKQTLWIP